ncbi:hypothetical protein [Sedimenticola sp.]|uniref:hypothetical protein n=1 Tax=Sedimenticola sp. TaxID=1940285 RepID=UPI003D0F328D
MRAVPILFLLLPGLLFAGNVEIVSAKAEAQSSGHYTVQVTLRHDDSGWEHYANAWRVLAPDGRVLGERKLLHPHVHEQPFTRGLTITIPNGIRYVDIEAQDSQHGTSQQRFRIWLNP